MRSQLVESLNLTSLGSQCFNLVIQVRDSVCVGLFFLCHLSDNLLHLQTSAEKFKSMA